MTNTNLIAVTMRPTVVTERDVFGTELEHREWDSDVTFRVDPQTAAVTWDVSDPWFDPCMTTIDLVRIEALDHEVAA